MNKKIEDYMCCIFSESDAGAAKEKLSWSIVKEYDSESYGHRLHTWDDGERFLARCTHCGKLLLVQNSEYHAPLYGDDSDYRDIFPVRDEAEAEEINRKYDGHSLERELDRPALFIWNNEAFWHEK